MKKFFALSIYFMFIFLDIHSQTDKQESFHKLPLKIIVPLAENCKIRTDGLFPDGEWKGALNFSISENFELLFLASTEYLYIGLKYAGKVADYGQPLDCVSELYISKSDTQFYNLHSSGHLAEGINTFSDNLKQAKYSVEAVNGWEANFGSHVRDNNLKCKGVEYKISLDKIGKYPCKLAGGLMAVNFSFRESGNFPEVYSFKNDDNWLELILTEGNTISK